MFETFSLATKSWDYCLICGFDIVQLHQMFECKQTCHDNSQLKFSYFKPTETI